jgi:hypothetical protein
MASWIDAMLVVSTVALLAPFLVAFVVALVFKSKLAWLVVLVGLLALASTVEAKVPGTDVKDTVKKTNGNPVTGKVRSPRPVGKVQGVFKNPALKRHSKRADRWYGCDKNRWGNWHCGIMVDLNTMMRGKHPTCSCFIKRSYKVAEVHCTCTGN